MLKLLHHEGTVYLIPGAFLITFFEGGLTSCTKEKTIDHTVNDTVTVRKTDTLTVTDTATIPDTMVTEAILTANPWKLLEIRGVDQGTVLYYLRGGLSNTTSFDNEYYVFNADHTGYEIDNAGITHNISQWALSNPDNPKLTCT